MLWFPEDRPALKALLARYTIAFSCCLAATLQGPHVDLSVLLADVLKPAEMQALLVHPHRIEFALQVLLNRC